VSPIQEDTIRSLAAFRVDQGQVVTLYLDVDGRRWPRYQDCEARVERMVRRRLERAAANGDTAVADALRRVEAHVKGGIDRSRTRGLAIFASGSELWEVFELPVSVRDQLVVNQTPHVRQLEAVVDNHCRLGVLLADRQRARMFVFELGELVDRSELFDQLPRHDDDRGDWDRDHVRDHVAVAAHHHLRRAAQVAFEVYKQRPFDHLVLGAPDEMAKELERELHSYLRDRLADRISVPVTAGEAEIRDAALEVERSLERARQAALVGRLRAAVAVGNGRRQDTTGRGGGVAGLEAVLTALFERRVDTLIVSDGFETPGWRCRGCGYLATRGRTCPFCGAEMHLLDDVVEDAIEEALLQSCRVEVVVGNADLDVMGSVGALLRF
jgi:peptide chain release factor subunit 1